MSGTVQRVSFMALGCRVSRADLDTMAAMVDGSFVVVPEGEPADFIVVNTCSITHDADSAARQAIRRAARENPAARIVVTGCYAELARDVLTALPGVAAVIGVRQQTAVPRILARLAGETALRPADRAPEEGPAWG
ncbi:MAG: hypothetical protein WCC48_14515, partial [Anaeromyxobacteraceae bacterium]